MSTSLDLMAVEKEMKCILETDQSLINLGTTIDVEPYEKDLEVPSISIYRQDSPFDIVTISTRSFEVKPVFDFECAVIDMNSVVAVYEQLDKLIDRVIRIIVDNRTWSSSQVLTSKPLKIIYAALGRHNIGGYKAIGIVSMELKISYT